MECYYVTHLKQVNSHAYTTHSYHHSQRAACEYNSYIVILILKYLQNYNTLQGVSITCYAQPCITYGQAVHLSVCLSIHHTLARCQNDTS